MRRPVAKPRPPRPHPRGRTPKLVTRPEIVEQICALIRAGNTFRCAAGVAGIPEGTFHRWMADGEKQAPGGAYRDFRERILRARETGEARLVALVSKAAEHDWKAAAHILSCRRPEDWAKRERHTIEGDVQGGLVGVQVYLPKLDSPPGSNGT